MFYHSMDNKHWHKVITTECRESMHNNIFPELYLHTNAYLVIIPAYSMQALSLLNYILALIVAKFGYSVSWAGSAQMAGLLFVFGGATGLMLVIGLITMVVFYATWHPSVSSPN